eukprot:CAMPEP_0179045160 /NCGR_PEP_ID=MMETSP0796-20121207/18037_1 /TAXON_ID=73915 /ORGANISM="Pyrodinium bahamense, Strain pbaha01" /LENGTH=372 /DNA_ID=CAMNT_0020741563 /DNA_START=326 /DNA_END=1444 /DNA_ORIENTATION=-
MAQATAKSEQPCLAPVAPLGAAEAQTRRSFERLDCDGTGRVSVTRFTALAIKDKRIAALVGLTGRSKADRAQARSPDVIFREMCNAGEQDLTWPAFQHFVALRLASAAEREEQDCREDTERVATAEQLLPDEVSEQARQVFETIDTDRSGSITGGELAVACVMNRSVAEFVAGVSHHGTCQRRSADKLFDEMDANGDREISLDEFQRFVALRRASTAEQEEQDERVDKEPVAAALQLLPDEVSGEARRVFERVDIDCSGFQRFAAPRRASAAAQEEQNFDQEDKELVSAALQEEAHQVFERIDTDRSGSITCGELAAACVMNRGVAEFVAGVSRHGTCRRRSADKLFNEMDTNGNNEVSFDEFLTFVARNRR